MVRISHKTFTEKHFRPGPFLASLVYPSALPSHTNDFHLTPILNICQEAVSICLQYPTHPLKNDAYRFFVFLTDTIVTREGRGGWSMQNAGSVYTFVKKNACILHTNSCIPNCSTWNIFICTITLLSKKLVNLDKNKRRTITRH